jgi:hypothetical protein
MNTRDMLDLAVELIERMELMYMNKGYLTTSEKELSDDLDKFMEQYYES